MKKTKLITSISLSIAALLGIGTFAGMLQAKTAHEAEAATTKTWTINQNQIIAGGSFAGSSGIWSWQGIDFYGDPKRTYTTGGNFISCYNADLKYATKFTASFYVIEAPAGAQMYILGAGTGAKVNLSTGQTVNKTWNIPSGNLSSGATTYMFYFTCPGNEFLYFRGTSETATMFSITAEIPSNVNVKVAAGTGVKSVWLDTNSSSTSGTKTSGEYEVGSNIYAFAKLAKGYNAKSAWTLVSGTANSENAIYRVGSKTLENAAHDFGTISADAQTFQLTFNGNTSTGGSMSKQNLTYDASATLNANAFTKTGYKFDHWATTSSDGGSKYNNQASLTASDVNNLYANRNLYAIWNPISYKVHYEANKPEAATTSISGIPSSDVSTKYDTNITLPNPSLAGFTFGGWYLDETLTNKKGNGGSTVKNLTTTADATVTLYAKWTLNQAVTNTINKIDAIPNPVVYPNSGNAIQQARASYNSCTSVEKGLVTNYDKLVEAETNYAKAEINSLPTPITYPDSMDEVLAARTYYNSLNNAQKAEIDNLEALEDAEVALTISAISAIELPVSYPDSGDILDDCSTLFTSLSLVQKGEVTNANKLADALTDYANKEAAYNVDALIDAIPNPVAYPSSKNAIEAARSAYNALTDTQKELVNDYADLSKAEVDLVKSAIDAIGTVSYPNSKSAIDAARALYNALDDTQKEKVSNYNVLVAAEKSYNDLKAAYDVDALIDNIPSQVAYPSSGEVINAARGAYNALTDEQKALVKDYADLSNAEVTYTELAISNILTPVEYPDSGDSIQTARDLYNALDDTQKASVSNAQDLFDKEKIYNDLGAAYMCRDLINAIAPVAYTEACDNAIKAARSAYDALDDDQRAIVGNDLLKVLEDSEAAYAAMDLINDIGELSNTEACKNAINDARDNYDGLTSDQKALVTPTMLKVLTDDEACWAVVEKINLIGDVDYNNLCRNRINAARNAYNALTDDQKEVFPEDALKVLEDAEKAYEAMRLIANIGTLDNNETCIGRIEDAREYYDALTDDQKALVKDNYVKVLEDDEAAMEVIIMIDNIGYVEYTEECKAKLDSVQEAYDALTSDQKTLVYNYKYLVYDEKLYDYYEHYIGGVSKVEEMINEIGEVTLEDEGLILAAREAYDKLTPAQQLEVENYDVLVAAEEALQAIKDSLAAIKEVEDLINAIGEVKYPDSAEAIAAARVAYQALSEEEQAQVNNYNKLTEAEERFAELKQKADADKAAADAVKDLINAIGEVKYPDSEEAINAAKEAYDALTSDQKALVDNHNKLTEAEERFAELAQKAEADKEAAQAVENLINAIGSVELTDACKEKIDAAREAYDALTDDQKSLVINYLVLTGAEMQYAELQNDREAADAVIAKIDAFGEVELTALCEDKINEARSSYNALSDAQKELTTNYNTLLEAEARLAELKEDKAAADEVIALINNIGEVELNDESKAKIDMVREAYDALTPEQKALVDNYNALTAAEDNYQGQADHQQFINDLTIGIIIGVSALVVFGGILVIFFVVIAAKRRKEEEEKQSKEIK